MDYREHDSNILFRPFTPTLFSMIRSARGLFNATRNTPADIFFSTFSLFVRGLKPSQLIEKEHRSRDADVPISIDI